MDDTGAPALAVHYSYASFWRRFAAFILDNAIIYIMLLPFIFIYLKKSGLWQALTAAAAMHATLPVDINNATGYMVLTQSLTQVFLYMALYRMVFVMLYHGIWEASKLQASPGKLAVRIKVVDVNGNRLTLIHSCARNLCKAISNITLLIGYIMALVTEKHQALHDKITNCYILKTSYDVPPIKGVQYAGFWLRAFAYLFDYILLIILLSPLNLLLTPGSKNPFTIMIENFQHPDNPIMPNIDAVIRESWVGLLSAFITFFYFASWKSSRFQATPGKITMGIRVTDALGLRLSFWRAAGRYVNKILSDLTLLIGYIMAGTTPKKQALHDELADTLVIRSQVPK